MNVIKPPRLVTGFQFKVYEGGLERGVDWGPTGEGESSKSPRRACEPWVSGARKLRHFEWAFRGISPTQDASITVA